MKNKKHVSLIGVVLMILFSIYSLTKSINSGSIWKISAASIGLLIFVVMFIVFYSKIRKQEIN